MIRTFSPSWMAAIPLKHVNLIVGMNGIGKTRLLSDIHESLSLASLFVHSSNLNEYSDIGRERLGALSKDRVSPVAYTQWGLVLYGALSLAKESNGTLFAVLIDDIEQHLHYKSMKAVWATLLGFDGVQLIATTHSREMLSAYVDSCQRVYATPQSMMQAIRLGRKKDGRVVATYYDYDQCLSIRHNGIEIR